ncbi:LOW QUALITY PROTEIN: hypothetical protein HID58_049146 [Brassica napus]|uniref:Uncharacterized protein n=1 Tax=Brassica napus TaxID=3708 RepID=A0ABQ8B4H7_BRANA|nr:LOW QUALITY PROTEIN: hypothetical protein HID58_049146 [Brassica napus]
MEGSPYRKFSISWKGARFQGPNSGFLLAGTWSVPLSGTRESGSCLEAGGNDTGVFFPNSLLLISRFRHRSRGNNLCTQVNQGCSFSAGFPYAGPRSIDPAILLYSGSEIWREKGKLLDVTSLSLSLTLRSSLPSAPEMRTESGLSPDSSSIGNRVRSSRVRVAPTDSMDSSDSSLDLTVKARKPKAIVARRTSPVGGSRYPPIGPTSVIGAEEVAVSRKKYELHDDVVIRVPDPEDKVSDFGMDEVPVYEGYFASGFRDQVPSLVAKISETLEISPGQLNPPAWRTLIALQNLVVPSGDITFFLEARSLQLRKSSRRIENGFRPLRETGRKNLPLCISQAFRLFGDWRTSCRNQEEYLDIGILMIFCLLDVHLPRVDCSLGKDTIEQVLRLPLERHQIPFLVSKAALKRCSIWGEMSGSKGDEALAEYKKAFEVMSARKAAPKRAASVEDDVEVQIIRSSKRQVGAAAVPSSSKFSLFSLRLDHSAHQPEYEGVPINSSAFGIGRGFFHGHLVASGEMAAAENVSLRSQLKNREKELNELKDAAETFDAEKSMAVNGAKVGARWELMPEWLSGQTDSRDPMNTLEQYKRVKTTEVELLGLPAPSFEYERQVPGDEEVKKTLEPAADDPPAN